VKGVVLMVSKGEKTADEKYPESMAIMTWEKDGLVFSIVKHPERGHACGYVRFPKRPVRERGYEGILVYVPVHGGITYAKEDKDGSMVYGFDCAHSDDWSESNPHGKKWTIGEIKKEIEKMAVGIQLAAKYEKRYLKAMTNKGRAKILEEYHNELKEKHGIIFNPDDNILVLLNILDGKI
jgi:hypothetical protein